MRTIFSAQLCYPLLEVGLDLLRPVRDIDLARGVDAVGDAALAENVPLADIFGAFHHLFGQMGRDEAHPLARAEDDVAWQDGGIADANRAVDLGQRRVQDRGRMDAAAEDVEILELEYAL